MIARRYFVLSAQSEPDLSDAVEAAMAQLQALGLSVFLDQVSSPDGASNHYEYFDEDGRAHLVFTQDPDTPSQHLLIETREPELGEQIAATLLERLPNLPLARLLKDARTPAGSRGALIRLAIGAGPRADAELLAAFEAGLAHADRQVRLDAIEGTSLTQWPECVALLERVAEQERDADLRQFAQDGLAVLLDGMGVEA